MFSQFVLPVSDDRLKVYTPYFRTVPKYSLTVATEEADYFYTPYILLGLRTKLQPWVNQHISEDISKVEFTADTLGPFEIGEEPLIPILFQAGYLTINEYHRTIHNNEITEYYTLKYPNLEVEESVKKYLRITDANNLPKYRRRHF